MGKSQKTIPSPVSANSQSFSRRDLLKTVAGLGAVALSSCTQVPKQSGDARGSTKGEGSNAQRSHSADAQSSLLAQRAEDYLQQILEVARGPEGLIISI